MTEQKITVKHRDDYHPHVSAGGGDLRTKQSFRDQCDINRIVKSHGQSGMFDHLNNTEPMYGDVSGSVELSAALALVDQADVSFMAMPSEVRAICLNDPVEFLARCADPHGFQELVEAGLPVSDSYTAPEPLEAPIAPPTGATEAVPTPPPVTPT